MLHFTDRTKYFLNSHPTDMRKGCEGLANIVRTAMEHNPKNYDEAFIFYSKDYRKVKILHSDINVHWWFTKHPLCKERVITATSSYKRTPLRA